MFKIGFVVNGKKNRKKRLLKEIAGLQRSANQFDLILKETSGIGDAIILAKELANNDCSHIISVGGDGTLNETINGVMQSTNPGAIVGVLTYGTANDFARTVPASSSLKHLLRSVESGASQKIDLGLITRLHTEEQRYFVNIASIGMGAEVVKKVNLSSKFWGSEITFFSAIVRTFSDYRNQLVRCDAGDWQWEGEANSIVVANARYFGNGMCIAPEADPTDGIFSVVINGDITLKDYLKNIITIKKGKKVQHPEVKYKAASELIIASVANKCFVEADGEFIGALPIKISMMKHKLNLLSTNG